MDRETPEPVSAPPVLGYLLYTDRKSGEVKQRYPIDAERISLGRDVDCDVRLHWDDVSRVHAEIHFDLLEGTATLDVIGTNGLYFLPAGSTKIKLDSSTRQPLATGDSFIIRKKQFRFEYPSESTLSTSIMSPSVMGSPARVKSTPMKGSALTPVRRRASHRLSLMPSDKTFVPLSPMKRRQSGVGQEGSTPKKSSLAQQQSLAEEEEEEVLEGIVDIQQNAEGDMIILETREESPVSVQTTPVPPKTPRSVPLPAPAQTPYLSTPVRVPSKVVMSTPPGPMTLHKALLLRSARKVWVETRPNDVEDAVEDGKIEVARRKSRSPTKEDEGGGKRKSLMSRKSVVEDESDSDEDVVDEEAALNEGGQYLLGEEQGADAFFVEEDSAEESLEADLSLDVAEENIVEPDPSIRAEQLGHLKQSTHNEEYEHNEEAISYAEVAGNSGEHDEQADEEDEEPSDLFTGAGGSFTPASSQRLNQFYTPQVQRHQAQPRRSLAAIGGPAMRMGGIPASPNPLGGGAFRPTPSKVPSTPLPASTQEEEDEAEETKPEMDTPMKKAVSERELAEIKKRRQSLATPRQLPSLPTSFKDPVRASFLVQTPSHPALTRSPVKDDAEEQDKDTPMGDLRSRLDKMRRESTAREVENGKANGRRATVGFVLPETPARPNILASASYTAAPTTRFMPSAPKSPKADAYDTDDNDKTPVSHRTPLRSAIKKVGTPFSLIRRTPIQEAQEEIPASPVEQSPTPSSPKIASQKTSHAAKTPDYRGVKTLLGSPAQAPKTPYMGDIKTLYPNIPSPVSPMLSGIKGMCPTLPVPPKTPDMRGMKTMFGQGQKEETGTPGMEGMQEMFASPISAPSVRQTKDGEEGDMSTELEEPIEYRSPKPATAKKNAAVSAKKPIQVQQDEEEDEEEEPVEYRSPIPAKRKAATSTKADVPVKAISPKTSKSGSSRTARAGKAVDDESAAQDDKKSVSTRTKRTAQPITTGTEDVEAAEKPSTSARRRNGAPTAPAATESNSKFSRRAVAPAQTDTAKADKAPTAAPSKTSRSRAVSARATKTTTSAPASPESKSVTSAPSRIARAKKPLIEAPEQEIVLGEPLDPSPVKKTQTVQADIPSKPSRSARTATATASSKAASVESTSAPSKRTRAKVDEAEKENEEKEEKSTSTSTRSRTVRGIKKEVADAQAAPIATRATRSRR